MNDVTYINYTDRACKIINIYGDLYTCDRFVILP